MNKHSFEIRRFRAADVAAVACLYRRAVRIGAAHAYPRTALIAWATPRQGISFLRNRLLATWTFVATDVAGRVLGFCEVMQNGHVRMLFTDPTATRRGIATALLDRGLAQARATGIRRFDTDASRVSAPVFARAGFRCTGRRMRGVSRARLLSHRMIRRG
ncbi:MAG: GNAT family N-acetyltransferase [Minwuia sp.]|nr:GNAT family N-acetyltransferase [Minwuia sp.]